jgi:hypothetical protein
LAGIKNNKLPFYNNLKSNKINISDLLLFAPLCVRSPMIALHLAMGKKLNLVNWESKENQSPQLCHHNHLQLSTQKQESNRVKTTHSFGNIK